MEDKQLKKLIKILGEDTYNLLTSMKDQELETAIVLAATDIQNVTDELNSNENYIKIKEDKSLLESGLKEVKKISNARIKAAVLLLNQRGVKVVKGA